MLARPSDLEEMVPNISIILPAYNAACYIQKAIESLRAGLDSAGYQYEVIVVNDGSTDDTAKELRSIQDGQVRVLHMPENAGKGAAVKRGIEGARGKFFVMTDADIPYGSESILGCVRRMEQGALVVFGDRTLNGQSRADVPLARVIMSHVYSTMINRLVFPSGLRDTQCGVKGFVEEFGRIFASRSRVNRFAFDLELVLLAAENGVPIVKLPVQMVRAETSSFRLVADALRMLLDVARMRIYKARQQYVDVGLRGYAASRGCREAMDERNAALQRVDSQEA